MHKIDDFIRVWPILLLPYVIYNIVYIRHNIPKLIQSSVSP